MFQVAEHLHMTVAELSEKLTVDELTYWVAWFEFKAQQQEVRR
jgi:hypothetical protein